MMAERTPLPAHPNQLTPALLTELIGAMHPGTCVTSVEVVESVGIGHMVSTAGRAKLRLGYAPGLPALPRDVQVKMIVGQRSRVPVNLFETEVGMYRRMLRKVAMERAFCLAADFDAASGNFILILEDVTLRGARFTDVLQTPLTPAQVGTLIDQLAILHACYWESSDLPAERSAGWLGSLVDGPTFEVFDSGRIVRLIDENVVDSTYRQDLVERFGHGPAALWEMVKKVHRHQIATIPCTLCHGDAGVHNSYLLPGDRGGWVDWQLSAIGPWTHDVHYLVCTALSIHDRRRHERALIQRYLDTLAGLGIAYRPSLDDAMAAYSLAMIWGLTIGWFTVPDFMYGIGIIATSLERLYAAIADHDVFRRIETLA